MTALAHTFDQGFGNGYADDGRWMGPPAEDDQPTVPGGIGYFGLLLLQEPDPAATQPRVPHRSHARN